MKLAVYCSGGRRPAAEDLAAVRRMLAAMDHGAEDEAPRAGGAAAVDGGALGWLHTSDAGSPVAMARSTGGGDHLLVAGAPVCVEGPPGRALEDALAAALAGDDAAAEHHLTSLDGGFAAVRWCAASRSLVVVTDFMGFQPLYVARVPAGGPLVIATELKALVAAGAVGAEPDPAGWGAFVSFGHTLGDRTLLAGARRVPAGTALRYTPTAAPPACAASERRYWHWPAPSRVRTTAEVDTGALVDALAESVRAYHGAYRQDGVVLLSGGFDSRLVLGVLQREGVPARALVVRHTDERYDADGRLAERAARRMGAPYAVHEPPADFYAGPGYRRYLWNTEVSYPSFELFIPRVAGAVRPGFGAVWEGVAPNAMQRLNRNPTHGGFDAYLVKACRPRASAAWRAFGAAFRREWADACYAAHHEALAEERARLRDDEFGVFEFAVRNRTRNRLAANPFAAFAPAALPFTPGVTRRFFDRTYALSGRVLGKSEVRLRIFREHFPTAGAEPFNSGGVLIPGVGRPSLEGRLLLLQRRVKGHPVARRALGGVLAWGRRGTGAFPREDAARGVLGGPLDAALAGDPLVNADALRAAVAVRARGPAADARAHLFHWAAARRVLLGAAPGAGG